MHSSRSQCPGNMDWSLGMNTPLNSLNRDLIDPVPASIAPAPQYHLQNCRPKLPTVAQTNHRYENKFNEIIQPQRPQIFSTGHPYETNSPKPPGNSQWIADHSVGSTSAAPVDDNLDSLVADKEGPSVESLDEIDKSELFFDCGSDIIEERIEDLKGYTRVEGAPPVVGFLTDEFIPIFVPVPGSVFTEYPTTPWHQQQQQHQASTAVALCNERPFTGQDGQLRLQHCSEDRELLLSGPTDQVRPATPPRRSPTHIEPLASLNRSPKHGQLSEDELEKKRKNKESYKKSIAKRKMKLKENEMLLLRLQEENIHLKAVKLQLKTEKSDIVNKILCALSSNELIREIFDII